ncbi:GNAT family N-acetyltransferase [Candidatus Saccharibacteria bacterium]|jgi:ribosomal protein S18 acetylase RimI-like enzyme|nr:GNAT family N-acetyltransferase [Candidatus Saccharibacteria bacterium]
MNIRLAKAEDKQVVYELFKQLKGEKSFDETRFDDNFAEIIKNKDRYIILLDVEGKTVGMTVINLVVALGKTEARVDEVIVDQQTRGKGAGTILMQGVEKYCWEQGCDYIEFTSRADRAAANHLYQKLGYKLRETNVYQKNSKTLDN